MSMTGGISFYDKNKALYEDGASCVASSNTDDQDLILGSNKYFRWESIGSDDTTTETLTITLPEAVAISRLFLLNHNFKEFTVQYGSTPSDFTNVVGLDDYSEASGISETDFSRTTAYYEFDEVTTDTIVISCTVAQTTDAQKFLHQFIATNELGTLEGYPGNSGVTLDRNDKKDTAISGRVHITKGYESASFKLSLSSYPKQNDIDVLDSLHDSETSFLVWLCGGCPDCFRLEQRGFRIEDLYQMKVYKSINNGYYKNVYSAGVEQDYNFVEVVK